MILRPRNVKTPQGKDVFLPVEANMALYEILATNRVLPVYGPIMPGYAGGMMRLDQFSAQFVVDAMWVLSRESDEPIWLIIDTPGGSVDHGMMIYDMMQLVSAPVHTICRSALSMGAVILAGGEPGHRYIFPNARVMLHQMQMSGVSGTPAELEAASEEAKRTARRLAEVLVDSGARKSISEIEDDIQVDNWIDAQEAIDYGLVDHIIKPGAFGRV